MCLSNLNVGLQPEQVIDAIAEHEDAESYINAIVERAHDDGFAVAVIRRLAAYVMFGSEDSEDRREAKNWIMDEIDQQFQEMDR